MADLLDDVWATRDFPVLREVARRIDAGEFSVSDSRVAEALGMDQPTVYQAAKALQRTGFVQIDEGYALSASFRNVTRAAYTTTGLHPNADDPLSALVRALNDEADRQPDEQDGSRLRTAAAAVAAVGRTVGQGVLTAYLTGQLPGH